MDLLVKLYALPSAAANPTPGVSIRRALAAEKQLVSKFVMKTFGPGWASECEVSFARMPVACFIAVARDTICGFACYDATARGYFGPLGVAEDYRRRRVGSALLTNALKDMAAHGYGYAIIGGATESQFYRSVGAIEIPDSTPGLYSGMLKSLP